jgi:hypothetical protein
MKTVFSSVLMIAVIVLVLYILYVYTLPKAGFRGGGGEAIGGRTGGSAYSGATAELEPGAF